MVSAAVMRLTATRDRRQGAFVATHGDRILDQFSKNADAFATAAPLTSPETLDLLLRAAGATQADTVLDVACGAGVVACAFATVVRHVTGIDVVPAMIERARALAAEKKVINVSWHVGNVLPLPFADWSFSIVTSRYAFHHFEHSARVLEEMKRVCQPGGRIAVVDMVASEDSAKAAALNEMEKLRDPSHVRAMPVKELESLFRGVSLTPRSPLFYRLEFELESVLGGSHPLPGDEAKVRERFDSSLRDDAMDLQVRRETNGIHFSYNIAVVAAHVP